MLYVWQVALRVLRGSSIRHYCKMISTCNVWKRPAVCAGSQTQTVLKRPAACAHSQPKVVSNGPQGCDATAWAQELALGTDDEDTSNARTVYLITLARLLSETANTTGLRDPSTLRHTYNTEGTSPSDAVTAELTSSERFLLAQPSAACLLTD